MATKKRQPKKVQPAKPLDLIPDYKPPKNRWVKAAGIAISLAALATTGAYIYTKRLPTLPPLPIVTPEPEPKPPTKPAPAFPVLLKVVDVRPYYVRAVRSDGQIEVRTGGTKAWRFYNPGMLVHGEFTKKQGALGSDGKIAIFASYTAGRKALEMLLFESNQNYKEMSVTDAIKKFAPTKDGFKPATYAKAVAQAAGVSLNTKLKDFTESQRTKFLDEIEKIEEYGQGKVQVFENEDDWKKRGY